MPMPVCTVHNASGRHSRQVPLSGYLVRYCLELASFLGELAFICGLHILQAV